MSIEVELNGKAGRVCDLAQRGSIRCPCIVRTTSEDVITGNVFGTLRHIRPHLWLPQLLNIGLNVEHHQQVWFKDFTIRLWERQARFPQELLRFREGRSEPDIIMEWENPEPTTLWIEAKYGAGLAEGTANSDENDQALRGIRTLLAATGYIQPNRLFQAPRRRALWLALLVRKPEPVVDQYRNNQQLVNAMPGVENLVVLPRQPFVGTITWEEIATVLGNQQIGMTSTERSLAGSLGDYISLKMGQYRPVVLGQQRGLSPLCQQTDQLIPA